MNELPNFKTSVFCEFILYQKTIKLLKNSYNVILCFFVKKVYTQIFCI